MRLRLKYSLTTLLLALSGLGVALAFVSSRLSDRRIAESLVLRRGGRITYDLQLGNARRQERFPWARSKDFLRSIMGASAVENAATIDFANGDYGADDSLLEKLCAFSEVKCLCLSRVEPYSRFRCHITDDGVYYLRQFRKLEVLQLCGAPVSDCATDHVAELRDLHTLWLEDTHLTDVGLEKLSTLSQLSELNVKNTYVTENGITHFKSRLPKCVVYWSDQ